MSTIFSQLIAAASEIKAVLDRYQPVDEGHDYSWPNHVYTSPIFRRAHIDIVDARESKKLYMMHLCIFPKLNDPSPIFGLDIIAGPNKVTGAFHDFSPVDPSHKLVEWFGHKVQTCNWSKPRELPDWAKQIFSGNMVAAGNIQDPTELKYFLDLALSNLGYYLNRIGEETNENFTQQQNKYCYWQKKNPHTPKVMAALGLDPQEVERFIGECLFPEINQGELCTAFSGVCRG